MFEGLNPFGGSSGSGSDVLLELLNVDPDKIDSKTRLNLVQIKGLTKLEWYNKILDPVNRDKDPFDLLMEVLNTRFKQYMISKDSLSRLESIEGLKHLIPAPQTENALNISGSGK